MKKFVGKKTSASIFIISKEERASLIGSPGLVFFSPGSGGLHTVLAYKMDSWVRSIFSLLKRRPRIF